MTHLDLLPILHYLVLVVVTLLAGLGPGWRLTPRAWRSDRVLLVPVFGLSVLTLLGSSLNLLGMPMSQGGRLATALCLAWGVQTLMSDGRAVLAALRRHAMVVLGGLVAGSLVLWSAVWAQAWNPYHDTYTYVTIADHLLSHSFSTPVAPDPAWPGTTQVALYQRLGFRMGANFFLALGTSLFGGTRTFDFYLPVLGCGMFVLTFATAGMARRLFAFGRTDATRAAWLYGTHGGIVLSTALMGFLPQTLGLPILMAYLTLQTSLRGPRWSRGAVLGSAVLFGTLVLMYLEVAPFAGVTACALAMVDLRRRPWAVVLRRWSVIGLAAVVGLALVPMSALQAVPALIVQAGVVVGMDPRLGVLDYLFVLAGLTPWWRHAALRPGALYTLGRAVAVALPILGVWAWLRAPRVTRARLGIALAISGGFTFVFAGAASNPFDPAVAGQPWSTLKIVSYYSWVYVLVIALAAGTLLRGRTWQRAAGVGVLLGLGVAAGGIAAGSAVWAAATMRNTVGSATPVAEYRRLAEIGRDAGAGVNLLMPGEALKHRQWVAYFLQAPVNTDWSDDVYIAPHLAAQQRRTAPKVGVPTLTYAPGAPGAIAGMVRSSAIIGFAEGWYGNESDGTAHWRWLEQRGTLGLQLLEAAQVTLTGDLAVPMPGGRTVTVQVEGPVAARASKAFPEQWFTPAEFGPFNLPAGTYVVSIAADGTPGRLGPNDPRAISVGLRNPRVRTAPFVAALPLPGADVGVVFVDGWFAEEADGTARWRWLEERGTLAVTLAEAADVTLTGEMAVVGGARTVTVAVDGAAPAWLTRALPEQWFTPVSLGPVSLPAGAHRLTITASGAPASLGPTDSRAVRIGWRNLALQASAPRAAARPAAVGARR